MSDMDLTPMTVDELKALIESWIAADTEGVKPGEVPPAVEEEYGEDPLAGVEHDTYLDALEQLHEEGVIPDDAYEQAHAQIEAGDDFNPQVLALNITTVDNSIHTGDDFRGHIEQGDTTTTNQTGNEGIAAGGDVYDSNAVTGDDANVASGDFAEAGDGDDIDASGSHITADEGSAIGFGSGHQEASNIDDHSWTDNSTFEDNSDNSLTDNSDNSFTDNSTNTDSFNSPYDSYNTEHSYNEDNDGEDIDDNDGYDEDFNTQTHVDVDIQDGYEESSDYVVDKAEEYVPEVSEYDGDDFDVD
jgi:hypothetical protein